MKSKYKLLSIISFILSLVFLSIGASFHSYRIQTEDISKYQLGVNMGISMITLFAVFLIIGLIFLFIYKKNKK